MRLSGLVTQVQLLPWFLPCYLLSDTLEGGLIPCRTLAFSHRAMTLLSAQAWCFSSEGGGNSHVTPPWPRSITWSSLDICKSGVCHSCAISQTRVEPQHWDGKKGSRFLSSLRAEAGELRVPQRTSARPQLISGQSGTKWDSLTVSYPVLMDSETLLLQGHLR